MKRIALMLLLIPLFAVSCTREIDGGFPDKITFPTEGGEKSYTGEIWISTIDIHDYDGKGVEVMDKQQDGSIVAEYDWLKVSTPDESSSILNLSAKPNTTGKSRKLYVNLNFVIGPEYTGITIVQD